MTKTTIRNDSDARNWLTENDISMPSTVERDGQTFVVESAACGRCGGSGYGPWIMDGGVCYDCRGRNTRNAVRHVAFKRWVQKVKADTTRREKAAAIERARAQAAQERMLEGQRDWCERNGFGRVTFEERDAARRAEQAARGAASQHIGAVGERREFTATIVAVVEWDNAYGTTYCHIMEDTDGNRIVWKASNTGFTVGERKAAKGDVIGFKATVKEHGTREGVKQTIVTRAKATSVAVPAAA